MESNKILGADILDILFEGRNKEYGAYELRKTYNGRLGRAMAVTGSLIAVLFLCGFVVRHRGKNVVRPNIADIDLTAVKAPTVDPPPPTPPPAPKATQVKTVIFTPPKIVKNEEVKKDEIPPDQSTLDNVKIGTMNHDGALDAGLTPPPVGDGNRGVVVAPKKEEGDDGSFMKIEKESEYPGGSGAWLRYLNKNLRTPDAAIDSEISGTVVVTFMVDGQGNVSEVEEVSGPENGGLSEEAVRVNKKSGKWTPALQNGRYVKSYKQQPITFMLMNQ